MSRGRIFWLASFPSSGNTWMRALLTALRGPDPANAHVNALGAIPNAANRRLIDQVSGVDSADLRPDEVLELRAEVHRRVGQGAGDPVLLKIHDRVGNTPSGSPLIPAEATRGVVYIVRNPLDVVGSYANHFGISIEKAVHTLNEETLTLASSMRGAHFQLPQELGSWSAHIRSWLGAAELTTMVVRYEDMLADPQKTFGAVAEFICLPSDPVAISAAVAASRFTRLKQQEEQEGFQERSPRAERFFRRGQAGGWRAELTPAQVDRVIAHHGAVMSEFGYLDASGSPV